MRQDKARTSPEGSELPQNWVILFTSALIITTTKAIFISILGYSYIQILLYFNIFNLAHKLFTFIVNNTLQIL